MDYKEKYEQALEVAKETYNKQPMYKDWLESMFPELSESEDERIRKGLIKAVSRTFDGNKLYGTDVTREEALAWLEKQGENKSDWSEEDEKIITGIINDIQKRLEDYPLEQLAEIYFKEIKWLKSIKQRIEGE